jgi:hypothetical protein
LNFCITEILLTFLGKDYTYERLNAAIGALEACKLELYRRVVGPYETGKAKENGDVYSGVCYDQRGSAVESSG